MPSTVETDGTAPSLSVPPTRPTSPVTEEDVPVMPSRVRFTTGTTILCSFQLLKSLLDIIFFGRGGGVEIKKILRKLSG